MSDKIGLGEWHFIKNFVDCDTWVSLIKGIRCIGQYLTCWFLNDSGFIWLFPIQSTISCPRSVASLLNLKLEAMNQGG